MPKFTTIEQQTTGAGAGASLIDPNIGSDLVNASRQLGAQVANAGGQIGAQVQRISDEKKAFDEKMRVARENTEINNSTTAFNEGLEASLRGMQESNDFDSFPDQFEKDQSSLRDQVLKNNNISELGKEALIQNLDSLSSRKRLEMNSLRRVKEIDYLNASYETNLEKAITSSSLEEANRLTNQAFEDSVIDKTAREKQLLLNVELVNYNQASEAIEAGPENFKQIIKEFPVSKENTRKLESHAEQLIARRQEEFTNELHREFTEIIVDDNFDLESSLALIDKLENSKAIKAPVAAGMRATFREAQERRDKLFIKSESDEMDAYFEKVKNNGFFDYSEMEEIIDHAVADGTYSQEKGEIKKGEFLKLGRQNASLQQEALSLNIKKEFREGKINAAQARDKYYDLLSSFTMVTPPKAIKDALANLKEIESEEEQRVADLSREADKVINELPKELFGVTDGQEVKEFQEDQKAKAAKISQIKDPVKRQLRMNEFITDQTDRMRLWVQSNNHIQHLIKANPELSSGEIRTEVMDIVGPQLDKDAFKEASKGITERLLNAFGVEVESINPFTGEPDE